jgi:hypothetical protein
MPSRSGDRGPRRPGAGVPGAAAGVTPPAALAAPLAAGASWLAVLSIAALAALFTLHRLYDFDVLWHVKTGEWILSTGEIPRTDPFGGRTAGIPWLDVAWGFQVVAAALVRSTGLLGLQLAIVAIVFATLLVFLARAPHTPLALGIGLLFVLAAGHRFLERPDVLAFPLLLMTMALVERLPRSPRSVIPLLALLTALWANLHGSFVLAPILVVASATGALLTRAGRDAASRYAGALLACLAAALANPRGPRVFEVLAPYLRSMLAAVGLRPPAEGLVVTEWTPTWVAMFRDAIFPTAAFALLVLLVVVSCAVRGRRCPLPRIACAVAMLALALAAVRNLLPFGAVAVFVVARNERERLDEADAPSGAPARGGAAHGGAARGGAANPFDAAWFRLLAAAMLVAVTLSYLHAVVSDAYYVDRQLPIVTGVGIYPDLVPEGAVAWLAEHEPPGRLFNNYNSGAYLLYRLYPGVRNYIDARFDVTEVNREIDRAMRDQAAFEALVARDGIGTIVLVHPAPETLSLLPRLSRDPQWTLAFRDANSTVYVKAGDAPVPRRATSVPLEPVVEPTAARLDAWLAGFKKRSLPAAELTDAFVSNVLGDHDRERQAYERALARSPDDPKALAFFATGTSAAPAR